MDGAADLHDRVCIYCRAQVAEHEPVEHILPDSLGCPEILVLDDGQVCRACNNRIGRADKKLIEAFAAVRPFGAFKTKKGKWPRADLPNATIERDGRVITMRIHAERPTNRGEGVINPSLRPAADQTTFNFAVAIRFDGRVSRGLHKIAIEFACLLRGREYVLDPAFDAVREYVLGTRSGFRHVLSWEQNLTRDQTLHGVHAILDLPARSPVVAMQICGMPFVVSLAHRTGEILEVGRELNAEAGAPVFRTFDARGVGRLP